MMFLYRLATISGGVVAAPIWHLRTAGDPRSRTILRQRLGHLPPWPPNAGGGSRKRIWLQAVSVGEVRLAATFLRAAREAGLEIETAVSSTTPTGIARAADLTGEEGGTPPIAAASFAFPVDLPWASRRALDTLRPAAFGTIETEIWPGLLAACARRGIPVFIANGSLSERSARRWGWMPGAIRHGLAAVRAACVQTSDDAERLLALGARPEAVVVTGNMKFDSRPADLLERAESLRQAMALAHGTPILIAGSTSAGEEAIVVEAWKSAAASVPGLVLVVAPRHRERFDEAAAAMEAAGARVLRRSRSTGTSPPRPGDAILLDTIGELETAYALADVAFVGGSLVPRGGQNPLEPARAGAPVLFGPGMDNFRDVAEALLACGGAFEVRDAASIARRTVALIADPSAHERASRAARRLVEEHSGATLRTIESLGRLIPEVFARRRP